MAIDVEPIRHLRDLTYEVVSFLSCDNYVSASDAFKEVMDYWDSDEMNAFRDAFTSSLSRRNVGVIEDWRNLLQGYDCSRHDFELFDYLGLGSSYKDLRTMYTSLFSLEEQLLKHT